MTPLSNHNANSSSPITPCTATAFRGRPSGYKAEACKLLDNLRNISRQSSRSLAFIPVRCPVRRRDSTTLAGPRASVNVYGKRLRLYGELLGGVANGCNSVFPGAQSTTPDAFSLALSMGGGADYRIHKHLLVRTADLSWLRTSLSNGTTSAQNNLRISSGLVIRF